MAAMKAREILGEQSSVSGITFFFNGDARGYALKLSLHFAKAKEYLDNNQVLNAWKLLLAEK
jgi:hypothetical protein